MTWIVERWGGHSHHKTRIIFIGSEDLARERFSRVAAALRQGEARLVHAGRVIERVNAVRARTHLA